MFARLAARLKSRRLGWLDIMAARPHRSAAHVEKFGSGLSPISWVAQVSAPSHMQSPRRDRTAKTIRRQTVKEPTTSYIGLDIHKESIAMAIADAAAWCAAKHSLRSRIMPNDPSSLSPGTSK